MSFDENAIMNTPAPTRLDLPEAQPRDVPLELLDTLKTRFGDRISTALAVREQHGRDESAFTMAPPVEITQSHTPNKPTGFRPDPFFDGPAAPTQPVNIDPFGLFESAAPARPAPPTVKPDPMNRTVAEHVRSLESYHTRTLVLGMIRLFQRRGIIGPDELQRLMANLVESGELKDTDRTE